MISTTNPYGIIDYSLLGLLFEGTEPSFDYQYEEVIFFVLNL